MPLHGFFCKRYREYFNALTANQHKLGVKFLLIFRQMKIFKLHYKTNSDTTKDVESFKGRIMKRWVNVSILIIALTVLPFLSGCPENDNYSASITINNLNNSSDSKLIIMLSKNPYIE